VAPVDVGEFELSDLAGAQPEPGQKQEHSPIPQPIGVVRTRTDYPLDILRHEKPGDRRELPACETRDGMLHARRASSGGAEKAKERAYGDSDGLGTLNSVRTRAVKDEGA
jgi:hypothetical protein